MNLDIIEAAVEQIVETVDLELVAEVLKEFVVRFWGTIESLVEEIDVRELLEIVRSLVKRE